MMKKFAVLLMAACLCVCFAQAQTCQFTIHHPGSASDNFTSIVADKQGRVWAGTDREGLYRYQNGTWVKATSLPNVTINQMAVNKDGGLWVAQSGTGGNNGPQGGLDYFSPGSLTSNHYFFSFVNNDRANYGLSSYRMQSVTVDNKGVVWAGGTWSFLNDGATYFHTPGGLSRLLPGADRFKEVNYDGANLPDYPGIRGPLLITQSGCIRNCLTLASGAREVLLGFVGNGDCAIPAKINKYRGTTTANNTTTIFSGAFTNANSPLPFTLAVRPNAVFIDRNENVWAGLSNGAGFMVYSRDSSLKQNAVTNWLNATPNLPPNTTVNPHAIAGGESSSFVAIGTTSGLYIYNGSGDFKSLVNYTVYNTANSNLPSNNIKGVAFDSKGNVWATTEQGVAQLPLGNLEMFALKPKRTDADIDYNNGSERYGVYKFKPEGCYLNENDIPSVAADGSGASLLIWKGPMANNMLFRINEDPAGQDFDQYGRFASVPNGANGDSIKVRYFHPKYLDGQYTGPGGEGRKITLEVYNPFENNKVVFSAKLKIVLPPVLMVHGVWSSKQAFGKLVDHLKANGFYKYKSHQVAAIGYDNPKHPEFPFSDYAHWIPNGIDELQRQCAANGMAVGKVDVIAHSRGGLFARQYIQGTYKDYRRDIHKLITLNTPHSGSQTANLTLDPRKITLLRPSIPPLPPTTYEKELGSLMQGPPIMEDYDDVSGAKQLRVDDNEITIKLNGTSALQKEQAAGVPSHAVATRYKFGVTAIEKLPITIATGGVVGLLAKGFISKMGGTALRKLVLQQGLKRGSGFVAAYLAEKLFDEGLVDYVLRQVYSGEINDIIVPWSSQIGGIDTTSVQALSKFDEGVIAHSTKNGLLANSLVYGPLDFLNGQIITGVPDAPQVHLKIVELLRAKASGNNFSTNGFHPPALQYTFLPGLRVREVTATADDTLRIQSVTPSLNIHGGDTVRTAVSGGTNVTSMLVEYSGNNGSYGSDFTDGNNATFVFPVPREAVGPIKVTAYGYSDNALVSLDTFNLQASLPTGVTLQRIEVSANGDDAVTLPAKQAVPLTVIGYYSDTARVISQLPGITYAFDKGGIASVTLPNTLKGILTGEDILTVTYQGKKDTVFVQVTDSVRTIGAPLPVSLNAFRAAFKNKLVYLYWTTAQELNNKHFDVEYSGDGLHFETVGTVPGKGTGNAINDYVFPTDRYKGGKNFYRLKQVDYDGKSKTSAYVVVNVDATRQYAITLYPNPAVNEVVLSLGQSTGERLQVRLSNAAGQEVWTTRLTQNTGNQSIKLPVLAKGVYVVTVADENGERIFSEKLLIR